MENDDIKFIEGNTYIYKIDNSEFKCIPLNKYIIENVDAFRLFEILKGSMTVSRIISLNGTFIPGESGIFIMPAKTNVPFLWELKEG